MFQTPTTGSRKTLGVILTEKNMKQITTIFIILLTIRLNGQNIKVQLSQDNFKTSSNLKLLTTDNNNCITFDLQNSYIPDLKSIDYLISSKLGHVTTLRKVNLNNLSQLNEENISSFLIQGSYSGDVKVISIKSRNYLFLSFYNDKKELIENIAYSIDGNLKYQDNPKFLANGKLEFCLSENKEQLLIVNEKKSTINYSIFDENLNEIKNSSIDLGYKCDSYYKNIKFTSKNIYLLGLNLKSDTKKIENNEINKLFSIDVSNNNISEKSIITKIENIVQFDIIFNASLDKVIVGGLLSNKKNNDYSSNKRNIIHGMFYSEFDSELKSLISSQSKKFDKELKGFCGNWNYTLKSLKLINDSSIFFISEQENLQTLEYNKMGESGSLNQAFHIGDIFLCALKVKAQNDNLWSFRIKKSSNLEKYSDLKFDSFLSLNKNGSIFIILNSNPDILNNKINNLTKEIELNTKNTIPVCLEVNSVNQLTIKKVFDDGINNLKYNIQTNNQLYIKENQSLFILDNGSEKKLGRLVLE